MKKYSLTLNQVSCMAILIICEVHPISTWSSSLFPHVALAFSLMEFLHFPLWNSCLFHNGTLALSLLELLPFPSWKSCLFPHATLAYTHRALVFHRTNLGNAAL